jgi:hypothetical protein
LRQKANVLSVRRIQQILRQLEKQGEIYTRPGGGRGRLSRFLICVGLTPDVVSQRIAHCFNSHQPQADTQDAISAKQLSPNLQTVQPSNLTKPATCHAVTPLKTANASSQFTLVPTLSTSTPNFKQREAKPRNGAKSIADPRTNHPAIVLYREVTGRYPNRLLYDAVIAALGTQPDPIKARACYHAWLERGYNPNAVTWATEWYLRDAPAPTAKPSNPSTSSGQAPQTSKNSLTLQPLHNHDPDLTAITTFLNNP